ncbi:MAG TPA: type I-E CRISPR-associated protein Cas6/Cse3/CasE [Phytomonospora sp.]
MYLTRVRLNPVRREGRKLLGSPQAMHAAVMLSFPQTPPAREDGARVLWRVDSGEGPRAVLYLVSPSRPDVRHIVEQAGWDAEGGSETRAYGGFLDGLAEGQRWAFRLTANPTMCAPKPEKHVRDETGARRTQRFGHVTIAQQAGWLLDRAARNGFRVVDAGSSAAVGEPVPNLVVSARETRRFRRQGAVVTLATATFDGVLEVADAGVFRRTLVAGLGPAKGYGCGLMTLAPTG